MVSGVKGPFQDLINLGKLKRFRMRSLTNPNWVRDPDHVLLYLTRGSVPTADERWPASSPLTDWINAAVRDTKEYRTFTRRTRGARRGGKDKVTDEKWTAVLRAIDALITEAENRHRWPVWRND